MDDSIHKKLFACLNPRRSHSNDILCASESVRACVCVLSVRGQSDAHVRENV